MAPTRSELLLGLPLALAAGALVGALGTFKHRVGLSVPSGPGLPIGLVLSLLMVAAVLAALRAAFGSRLFAGAAAVGVLLAVLVLSQPGPGGSVVVLGLPGTVWTSGATVLAVVAAAVPPVRLRKREPTDGILEVHREPEGTDL
jgi:hypothetical protein